MFKLKQKGRTGHDGTKNVQIIVPLKYVNNFWRTREIPLIDHVINLFLTCFPKCFIVVGTAITGTKLMFQLRLHQLKIIQNYYSNQKQVLKEQLVGINVNHNKHDRHETNIQIT